jgi:hypothetical protein
MPLCHASGWTEKINPPRFIAGLCLAFGANVYYIFYLHHSKILIFFVPLGCLTSV